MIAAQPDDAELVAVIGCAREHTHNKPVHKVIYGPYGCEEICGSCDSKRKVGERGTCTAAFPRFNARCHIPVYHSCAEMRREA